LHPPNVYARKPPRPGGEGSACRVAVALGVEEWLGARDGTSKIDKGRSLVASNSQGLAARYASALYELADGERALDNVAADLTQLRQLIAESPDLERLVRSPAMSRDDQAKGMAAVLEKSGAHALTQKFVGTVAMNRRLFAIEDMTKAFLDELARRRGEVAAEVTSAVGLTQEQIDAVNAALREAVGQKVAVNLAVDPSLIGGLVVRVGSRMVDSSIKTKLQRLQFAMKGVG
jgi:F-type H+-transporting ATPase subunit delta